MSAQYEESPFSPHELEVPTLPGFIGDEATNVTPLTMPSGPTFMDDWDTEEEPVEPTVLPVTGGKPLLYEGESHLTFGAGGTGKSWVGYYTVKTVAETGGISLILDYESNKRTVKERLKAMGVTKAQAGRIAYWSLTGSLLPNTETGKAFRAWVVKWAPSFVLMDSVSKALSAAGLKENENDDFNEFDAQFMMWLTSLRITNLSIDHTGHEGEGGKAKTKARGASSKEQRMSGATYMFEAVEHWTRNNSGLGKLTVGKEREGHRKSGSVAAEMVVTVANEGRSVDIEFRAPEANVGGGRKYTWYMEFVSNLLVEGGPMSKYKVEQAVKDAGKSKEYAAEAVKSLIADGFVSVAAGPRNSKVLTSVRPFVQDADEAPTGADDRHESANVRGF